MVQAWLCDSSNRMRAEWGRAGMSTSLAGQVRRFYPRLHRICARIEQIDAIDRQIVSLLVDDARRSYGDIGRHVSLSAPSVKRRVDALRASGAIEGFTAVLDHRALGQATEALIELFYAPGTLLDEVAGRIASH